MRILKIRNSSFGLLLLSMLFSACLKDTGNYQYDYGNAVEISYSVAHAQALQNAYVGQEFVFTPPRRFENENSSEDDYHHEWYMAGDLISQDATLTFVPTTLGSFPLRYYMIEKSTGIRFAAPTITIRVTSLYQTGWGILYEIEGKSEIAHLGLVANEYTLFTDLYQKYNDGEVLGSRPYRIKEYLIRGGRAMAVIQGGGQGSVELDPMTNKKYTVTKESFIGGVPANLEPINMGSYITSALLLNADGTLYPRYFPNPILPLAAPWLNQPLQIEKGMKIRDLWDTQAARTRFNFMYDELNHRILYVRLGGGNEDAGVIFIDELPDPLLNTPYPPDHVNPRDLGEWKYIWGGTFAEVNYNAEGAVLMMHPTSGEMYLQMFGYQMPATVPTLTPLSRNRFTGESLVDEASIYVAAKSRGYLFFSGGPDNRNLYYFDVRNGGPSKLYGEFSSRITALRQSDNSLELAVGFENGSISLLDISDPALITGTIHEKFSGEGLGKVIDITFKGGHMR